MERNIFCCLLCKLTFFIIITFCACAAVRGVMMGNDFWGNSCVRELRVWNRIMYSNVCNLQAAKTFDCTMLYMATVAIDFVKCCCR